MQGTTINGYKFVSLIGRGGMAEVWKAENGLGVCFAIKVLNANLSQDPAIVERFRSEAKIMVAMNHPNIRKVIDLVNLSDGRPCIIMEYLEGADLASRMRQGERFTEAQLRKWWNQMVDVLNYTHSQGIIHRDIKPSNIFINESGDVKLLDFGIARTGDGLGTRTGSNMGTLMYMSPEQVTDVSRVSKMSDVYSLAVTFVHLASGKPPYDSALTEYTIMDSIVKTPLDTSALPEPWNRWLKQYLIKEPASRAQLMRMTEGAPQFEKTPIPSQPIKAQPTGGDDGKNDKTRIESNKNEHKEKTFNIKWIWLIVACIIIFIMVLFIATNDNKRSNGYGVSESPTQKEQPKTQVELNLTSNDYDYVDLGLPSGTKWATCNVGAEKPEDFGNYYAFGETTTKESYTMDNYTYMSGHKGTLPSSVDAATTNWGVGWRTPTETEIEELVNKCSWKWTGNGYKVTGLNGNSIFLPAAGGFDESGVSKAGFSGAYWSNRCQGCGVAYILKFQSGSYSRYAGSCMWGLPVRPVHN